MYKSIPLQRMRSAFEQCYEKYIKTFLNKFVYSSLFEQILPPKNEIEDI